MELQERISGNLEGLEAAPITVISL